MLNSKLIQKIRQKFFPFYKNKDLKFVFKKLQEDFPKTPVNAMYVGGCVRKYLMGEKIDDIDIATSLTPDQVKEKFKDTKFNVIDTGIKHGTVTLILDKLKLELTTLRKDITTDGRHAEVEYTDNWKEDSNRRDFTINAIYLDTYGNIFDPQLGKKDLENNIVKFIGDPQKRIEEDYLRIVRFIRFSIDFQNKIEESTIVALKLNLNGIKQISKERIFLELQKILKSKNFYKLEKNEILKEIFLLIFPEFKYLERLKKLDIIPKKPFIDKDDLLSILIVDDKDNHEYFSHKYKISNDLRNKMNVFAQNFLNIRENKNFFLKDLKKNIFNYGKNHIKALNLFNFLNNKKIKLADFLKISKMIDGISLPEFPIDGNYLKGKGIEEGLIMGKVLRLLKEEWLKNNFELKEEQILKIIKDNNN